MKRVELVGPPGVGKSTLYQELRKRRRPNNSWAPQEEILPKFHKPATSGIAHRLVHELRRSDRRMYCLYSRVSTLRA